MKNKKKIIIGSWPLSGDYGPINLKELIKILEYSYDEDFFEYDTAPSYGNGKIEFLLGEILGNKKNIQINTKVGNQPFIGKSFEIDDLKRSFFQSLKRLKVNKINTLYLHNPRNEIKNYKEIKKFFKELKNQNLINKSGLSLAKNFQYDKKFLKFFDCIQEDLNLLSMDFLNLKKNDKQEFHARSPFASGILGKKLKNKVFHKEDHRSSWLNDIKRRKIIDLCVSRINSIIGKLDIKEVAFQFTYYNAKIDRVIFGIKNINHIKFLCKNLKKNRISNKKIDELINLNKQRFFVDEKNYKHLY